jgi:hypothetical protein
MLPWRPQRVSMHVHTLPQRQHNTHPEVCRVVLHEAEQRLRLRLVRVALVAPRVDRVCARRRVTLEHLSRVGACDLRHDAQQQQLVALPVDVLHGPLQRPHALVRVVDGHHQAAPRVLLLGAVRRGRWTQEAQQRHGACAAAPAGCAGDGCTGLCAAAAAGTRGARSPALAGLGVRRCWTLVPGAGTSRG